MLLLFLRLQSSTVTSRGDPTGLPCQRNPSPCLTNYTFGAISRSELDADAVPACRGVFEAPECDSPATSHDEAFKLVANTLNRVEDEFSGVAFDPGKHLDDGRLYPPQEDSRRDVPGRRDVIRYRSRGHNTWIGSNGAIRIEKIGKSREPSVCCLDKPGADGKTVEL